MLSSIGLEDAMREQGQTAGQVVLLGVPDSGMYSIRSSVFVRLQAPQKSSNLKTICALESAVDR